MATNLHIVNNREIEEKEKHITSFIKSLAAVEEAMEPFKDQKRMAVRAYRLMKTDTDMDQLLDFFQHVKKTVGNNG